jgi:predicted MFS family arabinose efflux permease
VLVANAAMQAVSGVFEPAIAALTVGLVGREVLTARMGRNAAWARAGNIAVAAMSAAAAQMFAARAVFLQVPFIAVLSAIAAMTLPYGRIDLRRARGLESGEGHQEGPQTWTHLLRFRPLLVFGACSFLYELADAPLLTLVGQRLGANDRGEGIVMTSALIVASQAGMLAASILVGKRADRLGHRWLMIVGFLMLPVQGVLTAVWNAPAWLIGLQVYGGVSSGIFAALTPIWLAEATSGTGRYNLSQGLMGTMRALGVSSSGLASELLVDHLGYRAAFIGCAVVAGAAAALLWAGLPDSSKAAASV